ncbi:MAG: PIN domain-containing protein [Gammaproteobacteria bacterium]|nr:PIN domain-containing protein [Gammaproteobacteria bacterium]
MSDKAFFDTNVLAYAFDSNEPEKAETAKKLIAEYGSTGKLVLSTQVLQELYVTLTRTGKLSIEKSKAI